MYVKSPLAVVNAMKLFNNSVHLFYLISMELSVQIFQTDFNVMDKV